METKLHNRVKIYKDTHAVAQLAQLVATYPSICKSEGFVQIPVERWIKVPLMLGWKAKASMIKHRVYPLGNKNRQVDDETIDEMHCLSRLEFTTEHIPFSFLVFVV